MQGVAGLSRRRRNYCSAELAQRQHSCNCKQAVRVATRYAPAPLLPRGRPSASRAAEQTQRSNIFSRRIYVPTLTAAAALRVKAALTKAAWWPWPLTFWPWKWCPSHVWRWLSLRQFWSFWSLCSRLRPDVRDRQTTDVRQTSDKSIA